MDLQGDEELEALRLAALATLKTKKKESENFTPDNISKVSTLITSKSVDKQNYSKDASDHPQYGNQAAWRNSKLPRRGRGRGGFPKGNQRSNLIVITPVNLCSKTDEKEDVPQLVLPQHKWCQSVNEDSSSPKSYRRIGPTRFNRHGSDSESSDESDYENSDNDSYSNDTVLQDEPSEPFPTFTREENTEDERLAEKRPTTPDRRLSFHNIESREKETEAADNSKKDAYLNSSKDETKPDKAASEENVSKPEREFSDNCHGATSGGDEPAPKVRSHSPIHFRKTQSSSVFENGDLPSKKDKISRNHKSYEKDTRKPSRKHSEIHAIADSRSDSPRNDSKNPGKNLSQGDLRHELKKRMQEKPPKNHATRSQNDSSDHSSPEQNRNRVRLRRSRSRDDSDHSYRHKSRDRRLQDRKSVARSRSSSENDRSVSPNRNHISHNHVKREHSHSSERSYKRSRSPERRSATRSRGRRRHGRSSSSSSSSSSGSSRSSSSASPRHRLVSSVVKPVTRMEEPKTRSSDSVPEKHPLSSSDSSSSAKYKRRRNSDEKPKILSSTVKSSVSGPEKLVNTSDTVKRVPVHMRLGTLPNKRIIRMTKDVEAAFVSTSSDEDTDVNIKCKKQNFRVVTELSGNKLDEVSKRHVEKGTCRKIDVFRGRRMKIER